MKKLFIFLVLLISSLAQAENIDSAIIYSFQYCEQYEDPEKMVISLCDSDHAATQLSFVNLATNESVNGIPQAKKGDFMFPKLSNGEYLLSCTGCVSSFDTSKIPSIRKEISDSNKAAFAENPYSYNPEESTAESTLQH